MSKLLCNVLKFSGEEKRPKYPPWLRAWLLVCCVIKVIMWPENVDIQHFGELIEICVRCFGLPNVSESVQHKYVHRSSLVSNSRLNGEDVVIYRNDSLNGLVSCPNRHWMEMIEQECTNLCIKVGRYLLEGILPQPRIRYYNLSRVYSISHTEQALSA